MAQAPPENKEDVMEQSFSNRLYALPQQMGSFSPLIKTTLDSTLPQFLSDSRWRDVARCMSEDERETLMESFALILELCVLALVHGHSTNTATNKIPTLITQELIKPLTALTATAIQTSLLRFVYNFEEVFKREQATKMF